MVDLGPEHLVEEEERKHFIGQTELKTRNLNSLSEEIEQRLLGVELEPENGVLLCLVHGDILIIGKLVIHNLHDLGHIGFGTTPTKNGLNLIYFGVQLGLSHQMGSR